MRLKREEVEKREAFVMDLFKKDPELSVAKANDAVKTQFGQKVRTKRIYELKAAVKVGAPTEQKAASRKPVLKRKGPHRKPAGIGHNFNAYVRQLVQQTVQDLVREAMSGENGAKA